MSPMPEPPDCREAPEALEEELRLEEATERPADESGRPIGVPGMRPEQLLCRPPAKAGGASADRIEPGGAERFEDRMDAFPGVACRSGFPEKPRCSGTADRRGAEMRCTELERPERPDIIDMVS
mmetsp:Transcript_171159/g.548620  ORF Transcript_171159/g.548620 Transcript_171159/m.548620 type:complete len:124 (+) Transcript_171159:509-880(+)